MRKLDKWLLEKAANLEKIEKAKAHIRKDAFKNASAFHDALRARGYELIGSGYYSWVMAKPNSDKVIKILPRPTDGWVQYVKWAHENGYAGKQAPRVYAYKWIKTKGKMAYRNCPGFGIALMERLDKTINEVENKDAVKLIPPLIHLVQKENDAAKNVVDSIVPGFSEMNIKMKEHFGDDASYDLHDKNFMVRKDGTLVLTDPFSGIAPAKNNFTESFKLKAVH